MKKQLFLALAALPCAGALFGSLAWLLQTHTAYHPPLYSAAPEWTPRQQYFADAAEAEKQRREAAQKRAELLTEMTPERMAEAGREIVTGKGLCLNCHVFADVKGGDQGPDLDGIGERAASRVEGLSDIDYLAQSLYYPEAFVVPDFAPTMLKVDEPPMGLSEDEIAMVIAFLQSLGGTPTVTLDMQLRPPEPEPAASAQKKTWGW